MRRVLAYDWLIMIAVVISLSFLLRPTQVTVTFEKLLDEARNHRLKSIAIKDDGSLEAFSRTGRVVYRCTRPRFSNAEIREKFRNEAALDVKEPTPYWKTLLYFICTLVGIIVAIRISVALSGRIIWWLGERFRLKRYRIALEFPGVEIAEEVLGLSGIGPHLHQIEKVSGDAAVAVVPEKASAISGGTSVWILRIIAGIYNQIDVWVYLSRIQSVLYWSRPGLSISQDILQFDAESEALPPGTCRAVECVLRVKELEPQFDAGYLDLLAAFNIGLCCRMRDSRVVIPCAGIFCFQNYRGEMPHLVNINSRNMHEFRAKHRARSSYLKLLSDLEHVIEKQDLTIIRNGASG